MKNDILKYLKSIKASAGETVEYGWFIFRIVSNGDDIDIETLDFNEMAKFTKDISIAADIHYNQMQVLKKYNENPERCNLQQYAVISNSLESNSNEIFMNRAQPNNENDSGWFVGVQDDMLDVNLPENLRLISLYELSLMHKELLPYWLLPQNYTIMLNSDNIEVKKA